MNSLFKTTARILAAIALCAAVSACTQAIPSGSFPATYSSSAVSSASSTSIMDY